jgi:hypothetical protein
MTKKLLKISKYKPSIFQGTFEFGNASLSLEHPRERFLLHALGVCLVAAIAFYLYFVTASVLNVMASKEALAQVDTIQGSIGQLEQRYLDLSESTTPDEAASLGLSPVASTEYLYRPGNVGAATIADNAN